jgi:photosystem II stability/assembly factor-like uncharacterized protein
MKRILIVGLLVIFCSSLSIASTKKGYQTFDSKIFKGMKFRSIGPAFTSGRIADFAVNPANPKEYYVGVASGNIWKTVNAGITWQPVFDKYGSYSIGCLAMDPTNPNVVWAGTGENNHQRSVSYGDGVYKTMDGGKNWKNMGLKNSRHIGKIVIDPKHPDTVYVAAEGSLWGPGGDRGLYKTTDGGKTWKRILYISENTGINEILMDPRNPEVLYASSEQRRRHVHTKIGGGPETAIYKSTDSGKSWNKLKNGLPEVHMGGMGLALSPVNPDVIYAIIEAANGKGGFFRSTDRGESWDKMSSHVSSGQYYNEIFCDPKDVDKVYSVETLTHYTEDGGKTFKQLGREYRHVDDHALWIDPSDTEHLIIGGDGGVYESYDSGANWIHKSNLPVTQFYRVAVDNSLPFYYVYGGTQDNSSMGGPSRNISSGGVTSDEWYITKGGDGFFSQIEPTNPDIVYSESQYGNIVRYDRKSGEGKFITPQPRKGEKTYRWNWNTPLIISPHSPTRLYCAANKVFRSDDRGDTWTVISDDLTAQIDRNRWPVMGKFWSADAVAKDVSSSQYGTIVSMDESPVKEGLLYVGTDDGLLRVTEDNGKTWRKISSFPGVPPHTYVSDILPSLYDENVVYISFDNRKRDDFKPYVLVSYDKGNTWRSIASNLPNWTVHTIAQDHVDKNLLFAGTEFGVFFSQNNGVGWIQLKGGIPTISIRDLVIQKRENDLVLATFGRGFYILENYTPLRTFDKKVAATEAHLFPAKPSLLYVQKSSKYGQGATKYMAKNPPFGATLYYYLKDEYKTRKQKRQKKEKNLFEKGRPIPNPTWEELRLENLEHPPYLLFTIKDAEGNIIRELRRKPEAGIHRVTWNLKYPSTNPEKNLKKNTFDPMAKDRGGFLVMPGTYTLSLARVVEGTLTPLAGPVEFKVNALSNTTLPAQDRAALDAFQREVAELTRVVRGASSRTDELLKKMIQIKQSLLRTPGAHQKLLPIADKILAELQNIKFALSGHRAKASYEEVPPHQKPLVRRLSKLIRGLTGSTANPSTTQKDGINVIKTEMKELLPRLKKISEQDIPKLEKEMETSRSPWTSGRDLNLD